MVCPGCGYDLRATEGNRCSECGAEFDRASLQISGFPWVHRRKIGRIRAYIATVWLVTIDSKRIRHEASKPQQLADGRAFRRVTAVLLALVFLTIFGFNVLHDEGLEFLAVEPVTPTNTPSISPPWLYDLAVPWSAGATLWPVIPACLCLGAWWFVAAPALALRPGRVSPVRHERAATIACYTVAPLTWLVPATCIWGIAAATIGRGWWGSPMWFDTTLVVLEVVSIVATLPLVPRILQWVMRVKHCGLEFALLDIGKVFALWMIIPIITLGLLPWCVGFLWIVIDSFR